MINYDIRLLILLFVVKFIIGWIQFCSFNEIYRICNGIQIKLWVIIIILLAKIIFTY